MPSLKHIVFNTTRDDKYRRLYEYFIYCEVREEAIKVTRITEILERTEATVYNRIRRHWNEFISKNNEQEGRSQYVVKGLKGVCPARYFVLAHRHRQTKYFFLFQTAILKHEKHLQRLQERKKLETTGRIYVFPEEPDDGIPPLIDDEGNELPEDRYPIPPTFDEEDEEADFENEDDERTEEDSKVPELIQLVYTGEPKPASVYVQPPPSEQEGESFEKPTLVNHAQGAQDLENKDSDSSSSAPTKSIFRRLLGIALILIVVAVVLKIFFFTIK
jgi:hypothetical protein